MVVAERKIQKSIYKGVTRVKYGWKAFFWHNRREQYIGIFETEKEAAKAHNEAVLKYHKKPRLNKIC